MMEPMISSEEVERMRAAGIPVPETLEEVRLLLEEAERDPEEIPLEEALRILDERIRERLAARMNA